MLKARRPFASIVRLGFVSILCVLAATAAPVVFHLRDADGRLHSISELRRHKAIVFLFLATDCPNSNSYAPEFARLYKDYENRGIAFYSVYSDPAETAVGVQTHDSEYAIPFPALLDPQQMLARETGARTTPEAVVVSATGEEIYRGRIDDRFANFGKTRIHVDRHDLRLALDQILEGKPVSNPDVPALGCAIPGINE
jgi:peroxiredoxin